MNWYNFEKRFPHSFELFRDWYQQRHTEEFRTFKSPVYKNKRLIEFFGFEGLTIQTKNENPDRPLGWNAYINAEVLKGFSTEREARSAGVYLAFEKLEQFLQYQGPERPKHIRQMSN